MKLESDVKAVLEKAVFTPDSLKIVEQLDRKLYVKVNKVVESVGGKWNKKRQVHIFTQDPRALFDLTAGKANPDAMTAESITKAVNAGITVACAPQLFPTPPALAKRMVETARIRPGDRVLEPSAGTGNILQWMHVSYHEGKRLSEEICVIAVEFNHTLASKLSERFPNVSVKCMDFLECNGEFGKFDRIVMNPPFENGSDIKHIKHALTMLKPGGRIVALSSTGPRQMRELMPLVAVNGGNYEELPAGTFDGTGVRAVMWIINGDVPSTVGTDWPERIGMTMAQKRGTLFEL